VDPNARQGKTRILAIHQRLRAAFTGCGCTHCQAFEHKLWRTGSGTYHFGILADRLDASAGATWRRPNPEYPRRNLLPRLAWPMLMRLLLPDAPRIGS
jgi:hypothetical protein